MGCMNNFVSSDKLLASGELRELDIIEFNRLTYSHFGIYMGHGYCVNVTGPDTGNSSSVSPGYAKGMKQAQRLTDIAGWKRGHDKVRVNNCHLIATTLNKKCRDTNEATELALAGLQRDAEGRVFLDTPIPFDYNLITNNCEHFVTRCRYVGEGFSIQAENLPFNSTLGSVERVTSAIRDDLAADIEDSNLPVGGKCVAAVAYAGFTAVGWTAYGVKTVADAFVGVLSNIFE